MGSYNKEVPKPPCRLYAGIQGVGLPDSLGKELQQDLGQAQVVGLEECRSRFSFKTRDRRGGVPKNGRGGGYLFRGSCHKDFGLPEEGALSWEGPRGSRRPP